MTRLDHYNPSADLPSRNGGPAPAPGTSSSYAVNGLGANGLRSNGEAVARPGAEQAGETLAQKLGVPFLDDLRDKPPADEFVKIVPIGFAREHRLMGLAGEGGRMTVALADLDAWDCVDVLSRLLDRPVDPVLAPPAEIAAAINQAYQERSGETEALIEKLDQDQVLAEVRALDGREDLLDVASRAPVIKLANLVLFEAVKMLASDVHVQPYENKLIVRVRIDGVLFDAFELPKGLHEELVSRIKVMGRMNIAEKRIAQDGRATVQVGERLIDLRISVVPSSHGERVVIRLLDKSARLYTLGELGMPAATLETFQELIGIEHGLVLVTGPTGSGKTTTLYAALQQIRTRELNVMTLEDPIEYELEGISQIQVASKKGMTFAGGLRSVLRQDPDIIMVGEIRDRETAVLAIQSALTGHLVFSTLHTNDAASAATRLLELGIEPYLVASSVVGIMAQRLIRRVCDRCGEPVPDAADSLKRLGSGLDDADIGAIRRGRGCEACRQTGYRGRVGLFELLTVNDSIRGRIQDRATASQIKADAAEHGMRTLRDDGLTKVFSGLTTPEEVVRVTTRSGK